MNKKILTLFFALLASCGAWAQNGWSVENLSGSTFTVSRTNTSVAETVRYRTVNLSAVAGQHYTAATGTLTFGVGDDSKTVTVEESNPDNNAYSYQTGTQRSYRFEVTDLGGFHLAHCDRARNYGTRVTSAAFNVKDVVVNSGEITVTDDNYSQAYHAVDVSNYFSNAAPKAYFVAAGASLRMTLTFQAKEVNDGYQHVQILVNQTSNHDEGAGNNNPGTMNYSSYMACFVHQGGSYNGNYANYSFPVTSAGNNCGTVANAWSSLSNTIGELRQQKFNSDCRATDGRLVIATSSALNNFSTLGIRFDASGDNEDTWVAKSSVAHIQAIDNAAPTKQAVTVAPGKHCKGNNVYVSVAFSEIVTVTGALTLSTSWGTLSYLGGSGSNVLTFSGTIPENASSSLTVTGLNINVNNDITVKDLAGNNFTWSGSHTLCSLDANFAYPITYDLAGGSVAIANPATYTWATGSFTLTNPTREGYTFAGWTGTGLNGPTMTVTVANHSHGDRYYTATWTPITYNLSYNLGGGSVATPNPDTYTIETPDFTLNNPTREGYTFAGWTGTGLDAATQTVTIAQGSTGHRSYTANWTPIVYNITYDYGIDGVSASNPATYTIETPTFTITNPSEPTGYFFLGWTGTGLDAATQTVTIAQGSIGDRSYTATWNNLWGVDADHDGTTAERAYVITTTDGLDLLATLVNGGNDFSDTFFKLGADIAYSYTSLWNDAESTENNYTSISNYNSYNRPFRGTFDGCGHTVSGIRINASNSYKGLFGYIEGGTVKNVILSDSRITGFQEVGGIVGENSGGTVENCHATATVAIYSRTSGPNPYKHGGIVGYNNGITATATVVGCTSAATVSGTGRDYGGVVGYNYYATVSRCLALGAAVNTSGSSSGPVVGGSNNNNVTDCHHRHCTVGGNAQNDLYTVVAGTGVTLAPAGDATVAYPYSGLQLYGSAILCDDTLYAPAGATINLNLINSVSSGQLGYTYDGFAASAGTLGGSANPYTLTLPSQDVTISAANLVDHWGIADGANGTYEHPYVITTPEGLLLLSAETNGGNSFDYAYFKLGADIDMSGVANFRPIDDFSGIFDGCRHTIGHLTVNWPDDYDIGLFGDLDGTVQNVTLSDATVTGTSEYASVGAIVGVNYGTIENCVVLNTTVTGINYVGAIAGDYHSTIENCVVLNTTVTGTSEYASVGAIVGGDVNQLDNLTRNYYHNCTVVRNGVTATSDIGTNDGDVNDIANGIHRAVEGDLFTLGVAAGQWQAIASPLTNNGSSQYLALTDLATGSYDLFGYYERDATWENMNDNFPDDLNLGDGYIYRSATGGTRTFVGLPYSENNYARNLYYRCSNEALRGFNLVGNPYNQPIAFSDISVPAGYGAIAPGYYTLDGDGTWQAHTAGTIAPGQGFLLQATEPHSGQNWARIQIDRPTGSKSSSQPSTFSSAGIAFTVSDGSHSDIAYALFAEGEGLRKMAHLDAEAPSLSIPQGAQRYAIATLSDSTQAFPLALQATPGEYTLSLERLGNLEALEHLDYIHLIDRETGADIDLLRDSTYTFHATGSDANRFTVKLSPSATHYPLSTTHFAHLSGDRLVIDGEGTLEAYDMIGRKLFSQEMNTNALTHLHINAFPAAGVYILRLAGQSQKIVIKK
ncbi:MAG: InlB B-repeat-containing protein [Bacteroidales bacterium]|nr:InlB B-repeat-containing protein [Bacteroidales bacterium]